MQEKKCFSSDQSLSSATAIFVFKISFSVLRNFLHTKYENPHTEQLLHTLNKQEKKGHFFSFKIFHHILEVLCYLSLIINKIISVVIRS